MTASPAFVFGRAAVAVLGTIVFAACVTACVDSGTSTAHSGSDSVASTLSTSSSSETTPPAPDAGMRSLGSANTNLKTQRPGAPAQLVVTNVRVGTHEGFERIVFEFHGSGDPGWFIDYSDSPTQQGSGRPIKYDGDHALNLYIKNVAMPFEVGRDDPNLSPVPGIGSAVSEVRSGGTFEGQAQFVIGLKDSKHPYKVRTEQNPTRLIIDVQH